MTTREPHLHSPWAASTLSQINYRHCCFFPVWISHQVPMLRIANGLHMSLIFYLRSSHLPQCEALSGLQSCGVWDRILRAKPEMGNKEYLSETSRGRAGRGVSSEAAKGSTATQIKHLLFLIFYSWTWRKTRNKKPWREWQQSADDPLESAKLKSLERYSIFIMWIINKNNWKIWKTCSFSKNIFIKEAQVNLKSQRIWLLKILAPLKRNFLH